MCHQPSVKRVEGRSPEQLGGDVFGGAALERAERRGRGHRPEPAPLGLRDVAVVEDDAVGRTNLESGFSLVQSPRQLPRASGAASTPDGRGR